MTKSKQIKHQDLCLTAADGIRDQSVIRLRKCDERDAAQVYCEDRSNFKWWCEGFCVSCCVTLRHNSRLIIFRIASACKSLARCVTFPLP